MKLFRIKLMSVLLVSVLFTNRTVSQDFIAAKSFVKEGKVYLRFVPNNNGTFNDCKEKGYSIKRIAWEQNTLPDTTAFMNSSTVFNAQKYDAQNKSWSDLIQTKDEAGFLYNMLYKPQDNKNQNMDMVYGLAMLSCDFDVELAKAAGLYFIDDNLPKGKYAYLVKPAENNSSTKNIKPAIILVNTAVDDVLKNIDSVHIENKRKKITLNWNEEKLKSSYTGYFIERSEDNKNFTPLNKKPYVQIKTPDEKNKKQIYYHDTLPEYGKTYYYRVRGLSHFGFYGNYSEVVACKAIKPLNAFPHADSTHLVNNTELQVHWHMPKNFNVAELKGFAIYRSEKMDSTYTLLNKNLVTKDEHTYLDKNPNASNYYKIVAYGLSGDTASSHPMLGLVPDTKPPDIPLGLKGKVDTSGIVILSWKANTEKDLQGYRVFRNNDPNEELVEITKIIWKDTLFKDTITLETLTEDVYYSITAVDRVFNNSDYCLAVKLKRPDKIKPVAAQFTEVIHTDSTITVKWVNSTSKDAMRYELYRSIQNKPYDKIKEWNATDSSTSFVDRHLEYASYYSYQLKVIDDDGNFSLSTAASHYFDARIRKPITKINYTVNREKRSIVLNWDYPEKDLYSFEIYKAKKGQPLKIIKTLNGKAFSFEDKALYIGNEYEYRIKAYFNSGAESFMSNAVIIEF